MSQGISDQGPFKMTSNSRPLQSLGGCLELRGSVLVDENSLINEVLELILELEVAL